MRMLGNGAMGSRRRYLAEQEVFMAELFAKAEGFTTPITKPVASFKAPGMGTGGAVAKPKAVLKPTGGKLPTSSERLATLKQNMADKIGQTGPSTGAPSAVGTVGKKLTWDAVGRFVEGANPYSWDAVPEGLAGKAGAMTSLGFGTGTAAYGLRQMAKEKKERQEKLRRRGKFQKTKPSTVAKALKVKIIPETKELPSFASRGRPGSAFEYMRAKNAKPRTITLPKKRPSTSEVRAAIREKGFTTSAGKRRVTSAKEINDATTDAMQDHGALIGGGLGSYGTLLRGRPYRLQKREPLKTSISEDDARKVIGRYGLKGPLPKELDREQKMAAYEARYVSAGGRKAEKWDRRARTADKVKTGGLAVATAGGAGWLATRGKLKSKINPKFTHHAETVAGAGAVAGGAGELYASHARRKRSSYASAPAGVAASALRRMRDYTKDA